MVRSIGATFWILFAIVYVITWHYLDKWGFMLWFCNSFIQPFMPPERDAYFCVKALGFVLLMCFGFAAKGSEK